MMSSLITTAYAAAGDALPGNFPSGALSADASTGVVAIADRIYQILTYLAYPIAFAAIIYIAYTLITSMGNPDGYAKAKKHIMYVVIGIFLIVFAFVIVNSFIGLLQK